MYVLRHTHLDSSASLNAIAFQVISRGFRARKRGALSETISFPFFVLPILGPSIDERYRSTIALWNHSCYRWRARVTGGPARSEPEGSLGSAQVLFPVSLPIPPMRQKPTNHQTPVTPMRRVIQKAAPHAPVQRV